jgi:hypothetical protein
VGSIPEQCPSCQNQLVITQLTCAFCGTSVAGQFELNIFSRLSTDDLNFVLMFVRSKGNVKEMEREIGISYWTIRRKLDEIVEFLDQASTQPRAGRSAQRILILQQLRSGEISVEEAAALLENIKRGGS